MKKTLIVHPNFQALGSAISSARKMEYPKVRFDTFPDAWPNFFVERVKECIEHQDVTYIGDFSRPEQLFHNYAMMRGILDYYAGKLRVILPYFPVGTMERISEKGEIATAKYFADIMSHLPPGRNAKTSIHTFDIHALVERFLFDSFQVNLETHTAMSTVREIGKNKVIVFPDEGAQKRFEKEFPNHEIIVLSKKRVGDERIIELKEGNPEGKDILLVDDLIQSGGTLIRAAEFLRSCGAKSLSAFATHGVFPNDSHIRISQYFDDIYITDSIPENVQRAENVKNLHCISLQTDIEKIIFSE